jgi:regulator of protease activity HflC (stomatin/prohibitin superfamily)
MDKGKKMSEIDELSKYLPSGGPKAFAKIVVGVVLVMVAYSSFAVVGPGQRGVVFSKFSGVKDIVMEEGFHLKMPFVEDVILVDVRVQKSQTDASAASKDLQTVSSTIALNFHIDPSKANNVFQDIGTAFKERVIDPSVQESVKAITAEFTAEELITRRPVVKDRIKEDLTERLLVFNIIMVEFNIIEFSFSSGFNQAIEAKQTAEQQALKAKRDLERIKIEAEQMITRAKAEAESQRLQRETISPIILQLRAIEKWDGHFPQVIGGAMPFIDVGQLAPKR